MPIDFINNLPRATQSASALSLVVLSSAIAYRVIRSTDFELSIANNKLQTSNQIYKTQQLLNDLDTATKELKLQQEQYWELKAKYDEILERAEGRGQKAEGLRELQPSIEKIEKPAGDLNAIADKISESQEQLNELISN